jgi:hypothetical protein
VRIFQPSRQGVSGRSPATTGSFDASGARSGHERGGFSYCFRMGPNALGRARAEQDRREFAQWGVFARLPCPASHEPDEQDQAGCRDAVDSEPIRVLYDFDEHSQAANTSSTMRLTSAGEASREAFLYLHTESV